MIIAAAATTIAGTGLTTVIGIAAGVSLIAFLISKELANATGSGTSLRIARFFSVGILPLVMAFTVIVAIKIAQALA